MPDDNRTDSEEAPPEDGPINGDPNTVTKTAKSDRREQQGKPMTRFEAWQIRLAIVAALLGLLGLLIIYTQTVIMGAQTELMKGQLEAGEKAARKAAEQNKIAFEASTAQSRAALEASTAQSKAALDASIKQSRLDQRAWVGVVQVTSPTHIVGRSKVYMKIGEPLKFAAVVTNSGKTPALNLTSRLTFKSFASGERFKPDYGTQPSRRSEIIIQPGMRARLEASSVFLTGTSRPPRVTKGDVECACPLG